MEYEIYIDVFFLVNFVMDYLVLLAAGKLLSCTATQGRIAAGAFLGALATCLVICIPVSPVIRLILFHTAVNTGMVKTALRTRGPVQLLKGLGFLYLAGFLLGGMMTSLSQFAGEAMRTGLLFFALAICSYTVLSAGVSRVRKFWRMKEFRCEVTVWLGGHRIRTKAVIDSGNGLFDSLTGKPVHIISRKAMEKLTDGGTMPTARFIPYQTIRESGVLPLVTADRLCIHGREEKNVEKPLLGISDREMFAEGEYEMILHPDDC